MSILNIREPDGSIVKLEYHKALPSTLNLARIYAKANYPDRYVVFADKLLKISDQDTKGPREKIYTGVYFSCILRPSLFTSQASLIGPMAAVAFVTALEEHTTKTLGIGWIGDVFCEGEKIGGISVEGKLDGEHNFEYIIVNFAADLDEKHFPPRLADMVRKVFESENTSVSMIIARTILAKFFTLFNNYKTNTKFMDIYSTKFIQRSQRVKYNDGTKRKSARVLGVSNEDASLIVETQDREILHLTPARRVAIRNKFKRTKAKK